mgnify:CR=1 FL=1
MLTNIVHLRKEAIPKLLGLLGNALASGDSEFILKEDNYSGGKTIVKFGKDIIDEYGGEEPIDITSLQGVSVDGLQGYTEEELSEMDKSFYCNEIRLLIFRRAILKLIVKIISFSSANF